MTSPKDFIYWYPWVRYQYGTFISNLVKENLHYFMTLSNEPSSLKSWHASWGAVDLRNSFWRFRLQVQLKHWWLIADLLLVDLDAVFLCVQNDLLLDGLTDLFETLGVYRVWPGLLHGVHFDFRSKPKNRKLAVFRKPEVENIRTGSRKLSHRKARRFL